MDDSERPQASEQPNIPAPDLDNLEPWLNMYINKTPQGFGVLKHPDSTPFTPEEQVQTFRKQLHQWARELRVEGKYRQPDDSIKRGLVATAKEFNVSFQESDKIT